MKLCLDAGNSTIAGAFFDGSKLSGHFTFKTGARDFVWSAETFGELFDEIFESRDIDKNLIDEILISSVVSRIDGALKEACERYSPKIFFLNAGNVAAAKIKIDPAAAAGADLLAAAVAAANRFPQKNAVIVDFGTVTTITAVDKDGTFLGASFIPGMGIQSKSLGLASDNLFQIDVKAPQKILGTSTKSALESGVFFGTYGAVKYSTEKMIEEVFPEGAIIVGTGGYVKLFEDKGLLDYICPDMVIEGLLYWRGDL